MIPSRLSDFRDRIGHQLAFDDAFPIPTFHIRRHFRAAACFVNGVVIFSAHVWMLFSSTIIVVMLASSPLGCQNFEDPCQWARGSKTRCIRDGQSPIRYSGNMTCGGSVCRWQIINHWFEFRPRCQIITALAILIKTHKTFSFYETLQHCSMAKRN